jgi:hypothetical protein
VLRALSSHLLLLCKFFPVPNRSLWSARAPNRWLDGHPHLQTCWSAKLPVRFPFTQAALLQYGGALGVYHMPKASVKNSYFLATFRLGFDIANDPCNFITKRNGASAQNYRHAFPA